MWVRFRETGEVCTSVLFICSVIVRVLHFYGAIGQVCVVMYLYMSTSKERY